MGHSTEAPEIHPHREPHRVCVCVCVCVNAYMCAYVCLREREKVERELNQCFTNGALM